MDTYLKLTFDKVISIGSNCYPKCFIQASLYGGETEFFDYIGTSMWSINELLVNDFISI